MEKETSEINQFKHYLELRYSPSTIKQYSWAFISFSKQLQSQEEVDHFLISKVYNAKNNPFYKGFLKAYIDCFELPFKITPSKRKRPPKSKEYTFLTHEQIQLIIDKSIPWISLLVRIYFETGLRLRELMNTTREDINLEERTIKGIGKGNKPFKVKFSTTTKELLSVWMLSNNREYVFHFNEEKKDHARSFYYFLKVQCEELGMPDVHPHMIRHALGHYLKFDLGFDLQQIKAKLRHANLETTEIYAQISKEEVEKIDERLFEDA